MHTPALPATRTAARLSALPNLMLVSIIIPVGPRHERVARQAIYSAQQQTIPCEILPVHDSAGRGAGWARNEGVRQANGRFIVFLDADDLIYPTFVEDTLRVWQTGTYVYTDWRWQDGEVRPAPDRLAWGEHGWHIVTTLLLKKHFVSYGGFDETLPVNEDSDLYFKLTANGVCGKRLAKPLVMYRSLGYRSKALLNTPTYNATLKTIYERYGGRNIMGCCGDEVGQQPPPNEPADGDVLVRAMWEGNRKFSSRFSTRSYPRTGNGKLVWVDPRDVAKIPDLVLVDVDDPDLTDEIRAVLEQRGQFAPQFTGQNEAWIRQQIEAADQAALAASMPNVHMKPAASTPTAPAAPIDPLVPAGVIQTERRPPHHAIMDQFMPPPVIDPVTTNAVAATDAVQTEGEEVAKEADVFDDLDNILWGDPTKEASAENKPIKDAKPPKATKPKRNAGSQSI